MRKAYEKLGIARSRDRVSTMDLIDALITDFVECMGDRLGKEDRAIIGGIGLFHDIPVTVIGHRKGRTLEENLACNFAMASPEGHRKALRLMEQAEKFHRPVLTFIDTPGAYPGKEAEERGQAASIAELIGRSSSLASPHVSVILGEGNSGGALALATGDHLCMLENAVYSILSPEGFASILWKDPARVEEACDIMKITADDLKSFGLVDAVIKESSTMVEELDQHLLKVIKGLQKMRRTSLLAARYEKLRNFERERRPVDYNRL